MRHDLTSSSVVLVRIALVFLATSMDISPVVKGIHHLSHFGSLETKQPEPSLDGSTMAVAGLQRIVVIAVEFNDVRHSKSKDEIDAMMRQNDAYWREVSYGKISTQWVATGWYKLGKSLDYYGADMREKGNDVHGSQLLSDAVLAADMDVDYRTFKHVFVVHAGMDQRISNRTNDLWPHFWSQLGIQTNDRVKVDCALYVAEFARLNAYVHEFAHSLGLPDLYPRDETKRRLVGVWSPMDSGEWLGNPIGSSPARPEAWSTIRLGWLSPLEIQPSDAGTNVTLLPLGVSEGTRVIRIPAGNKLYYLVEFRRKIGVDQSLPFIDGLIISLINETALRGYDGYGVVNVTRYISVFEKGTYGDRFRKIFVKLFSYNEVSCIILVGSRSARLDYHNIPSRVYLFIPYQVTLRFVDPESKPVKGLLARIRIDGSTQSLVTNEKGEAYATMHFASMGPTKVLIETEGILENDISLSVQADPTWIFYAIVLTAIVILVIWRRTRHMRSGLC